MARRSEDAPILVTGAHRSGTTWVGKMLALAPGVAYVHEPFNPRTPPGISPARFDRFYAVVTDENEDAYLPGLTRTLRLEYDWRAQVRSVRSLRDAGRGVRDLAAVTRARRAHARPIVKDPIALLSAEWLAARFCMDVVVLIRHPGAFVASLKRLGWTHRFDTFIDENGTVPEIVRPYEREIRAEAARASVDVVAQASLFWRILYNAVDGYRARHDDWIFPRHEDLSRDAEGEFERLYARLGLEWTSAVRREIAGASSTENPDVPDSTHAIRVDSSANVDRWRSVLTRQEADEVRESTADVWPRFYSDDDW